MCFQPVLASSEVELMNPFPRSENNPFPILHASGCIHQRIDVVNLDPSCFIWKGLCAFLTFWNNFRLEFEVGKGD